MSILIDKDTKVIVQGITGRDGSFHTQQMIDYGTKVVGGVTPGKGGQTACGVPVFNSVAEAVAATGATASGMYVPAAFAKGAMLDAANSKIELLVAITEGVPTLDVLEAYEALTAGCLAPTAPESPGGCKIIVLARLQDRIGVIRATAPSPMRS